VNDGPPAGADRQAPASAGEPPAPDVAEIVAELEARVAADRAAGVYPTALLERLDTPFHPDEGLDPPEASVIVQSARPIRSRIPVLGGAAVFAKRVTRRMLAWYVAPIAQDQTRFNQAILRELRALEWRVARIEESSPHPDGGDGGEEAGAETPEG
jgi:hypothetical protein